MTRYICSECGSEIPCVSDFCYQCGSLRSKAFRIDEGGEMEDGEVPCPNCGKPIEKDAKFCRHCGIETGSFPASGIPAAPHVFSPMVLRKNGALAMGLAFLFGFLGIYGLGHLVLKKWSRGIMFLSMSAVNWYIYIATGNLVTVVMLISLFIFFRQSMEVTVLAYGRE
ncbi:MAG: zinc-ribbon domain-containing protein [Candidatus Methanomethylophilaceae archaeon]